MPGLRWSKLPKVLASDDRTLLIERVDRKGERHELQIDDTIAAAGFYDLASMKVSLARGGIYDASIGGHKMLFQIDAKATCRPGPGRQPLAALPAAPSGRSASMDPVRLRAAAARRSDRPRRRSSRRLTTRARRRFASFSIDLLTMLRWRAFGDAHPPASSPHQVVVALDEETFRTPPFEGTPSVTWTHEIGQVLTAILDGGAKVVGFDVVFPTSIEQSTVPFGDDTLGARLRGFDPDYLRARSRSARARRQGRARAGPASGKSGAALARAARRGRILAGHNIRALNAYDDPDGVIRRMPLQFTVDGQPVPSIAA